MRREGLKVGFLAGTLGRGGAERQLVHMLRALKQLDVRTRVFSLTQGEAFEDEIKSLGVSVKWIGESGSQAMRLKSLIQVLRCETPDILQSTHFYTNLYATVAARVTGVHEIGAIRSNLFSELKAHPMLGNAILSWPRHLIANTEIARRTAIARGIRPDRIDFVRNAVDTGWLKEKNGHCEKNSHGEREALRILFVGRLVMVKRPEVFLRVISKVIQALRAQSLKAIIAGDGSLRQHLESQAVALGLHSDQLEFLGTRSDMKAVYAGADLLLMTSEYEGAPNAILEAMACGLPVIATSVGGVPEILADGRGLLVEPGDEEGLKAAVLRLASDASLRAQLGRHGYEYVSRLHSLEALGQHLTTIYDRILSR